MEYHERNMAYTEWEKDRKRESFHFSSFMDNKENRQYIDMAFTSGIEIGESSANFYHVKLADRKCIWIKQNEYYCKSSCGLTMVVVREEIKENIYCRKCGKLIIIK